MTTAAEILEKARSREDARAAAYRPIDYDRMNRIGRAQKAALTRAINSGDRARMIETCAKAVAEWDEIGAWPDHWNRWQIALDDVFPVFHAPDLRDLRA
jgi:hypothetical protein